MQNAYRQKGSVTVIVALLLVFLVGGVIFFFVSKPFQTEVRDAYDGATEWTPENIQKNPVGYLSWALRETGNTKQKLEASQLAIRTKLNEAKRSLQKHESEQTGATKLLAEFKAAYGEVKAGTAEWPIKVRGFSFDESTFKNKVVEANAKIENTGRMVNTFQQMIVKLEGHAAKVSSKLTEVSELESKLSADLEIAKVQKSVEGIGEIGDRLNAIMDTSAALAGGADDISIDSMLDGNPATKTDEEFDKIMGM